MQEALRLFAALEPMTIDWILSAGLERKIAPDEAIAVEGQELGALVVVLEGLFAVRIGGHENAPLVLLGPGELVGEISFLENLPATASVVACEDSRVLCIARVDLERRIQTDPAFAVDLYRALARVLSRRLRERSLALAASIGVGGPVLTPAWASVVAALAAFKDLLRHADAAAGHNELEIPSDLFEKIQRKFEEMCAGLTQLTREVTNTDVLGEVEGVVRREFVPYLHLTRTS